MFKRLFGPREPAPVAVVVQTHVQSAGSSSTSKTIDSIQKLADNEEQLEKRKAMVEKKIEAELHKALELKKAGRTSAAVQCMKRKKLLEAQIQNIDNLIMRCMEQRAMMEGQSTTVSVVSTMHKAALTAKENMKEMNVDKVDKVLEDINETNDQMKQMHEALGAPLGMAADIDEDELMGELAELDAELEGEVMEAAPAPRTKVPASKLPAAAAKAKPAASKAKTEEQLELEQLQAEMAQLA